MKTLLINKKALNCYLLSPFALHSLLVFFLSFAFKWCFAGGPMMARLLWYFDPSSPHEKQTNKKQTKKNK